MKTKELREKSDAELAKMLAESRGSLRDLRFKGAAHQLKDVREVREGKRLVARILTLMTQRRNVGPAK